MSGRGSTVKPPTERFLRSIERDLRKLPVGTHRAVGGGVYLRLDHDGARRFTYRGARGIPGGTAPTWEEAYRRRASVIERVGLLARDVEALDRYQLRELTIAEYAAAVWWPAWSITVERITAADYRRILLRDLLPLLGTKTMRELDELPVLIDRLQEQLRERKRFPAGHKRAGEVPLAACKNVLKVLRAICEDARQRGVLTRNPIRGARLFTRPKRTEIAEAKVLRSEVKTPSIVGMIMSGMYGSTPTQLLARRLIPLLILIGLRPEVICGMKWETQRTAAGPLPRLCCPEAVKLVNGKPEVGAPKTGTCEPLQFPTIARLLDQLYELRGRPDLTALVFPNARGGLLDWNNFRQGVWYRALHRAGIAAAAAPSAAGAFHPYILRHIGVTTMLHVRRDIGDGAYTPVEVAKQFSHTAQTLFRVYADVLDDIQGVAGNTMDEVLTATLRDVWGPMPGDPDYVDEWLTTVEAAERTGLSVSSIGDRLRRGTIRGRRVNGRYQVTRFELDWTGLASPWSQRDRATKCRM
jgi:integrase